MNTNLPADLPLPTAAPARAGSQRVLHVRLKDKHAAWLRELSREVNFVWNYCNEISPKIFEREGRFPTGYDLWPFLVGATKCGLNLPAQTVQAISEEHARRRAQHKKHHLAWRTHSGARRNLGWIPLKLGSLKYHGGQVFFMKRPLSLWDSYGLSNFELRAGNFAEDSRGRWYLNVTIVIPELVGPPVAAMAGKDDLGIDLGLKDLAGLSTGEVLEARKFYRELEPKLAIAQRAGKKMRARAIQAKIANRRRDNLHKISHRLAHAHRVIFVGNVNAAGLAQTRLAKSVSDAGWSTFRTMLRYKCADAKAGFAEVNESYSTQTCSACGTRKGPRGTNGLRVREWACPDCGAVHHRDVNAARNILAAGRGRPAEGIPRAA